MRARIQKWGNSLALRIPKPLADQACIAQGSLVEVTIAGRVLQVESIAVDAYSLDALMSGVTEENRHDEIVSGPARGREAW